LFYLLTSSFKISWEFKKAIQSYLSFWGDKGLSKVQGENVARAELLIIGCCKRLDAVGSLGSEYVIDVPECLHVCPNPEFKNMFEVMLNMAKLGNYDILSITLQSSTPTVRLTSNHDPEMGASIVRAWPAELSLNNRYALLNNR